MATQGFPDNEVRMVLIGKTGCGKSSAGNTILGEEKYRPVRGWSSGTERCDWDHTFRNGIHIQVTDTPGVCDTHRTSEDVHREIAKSIATVTPGPHAVLMVLKAGERFTKEEEAAYEELKRLFGEKITDFMIVVFTGLDLLEGQTIQEAVKNAPPKVRQIVNDAHERYIAFNNELPWSDRTRQGDHLLDLVCQMMKQNGGKYYSNDLVGRVESIIQTEMKSGKTREEIKQDVVKEKNVDIFSRLSGYFSQICSVM